MMVAEFVEAIDYIDNKRGYWACGPVEIIPNEPDAGNAAEGKRCLRLP